MAESLDSSLQEVKINPKSICTHLGENYQCNKPSNLSCQWMSYDLGCDLYRNHQTETQRIKRISLEQNKYHKAS